jgi:MFS family permease
MVIPAVIYGLLSFAIPESPRFLLSVGRDREARAVLADVEGKDADLDARVTEIRTAMRREHKASFRDLLNPRSGRMPNFLPIVWIGIGLSAFQQLVGINVAFYYSATLWQSVGIDPSSSFLYSFTTSIVNIIGTVIAMIFVDRIGRRPLALIGSAGMTVALALEAWAFSAKHGATLPTAEGTVALVAALLRAVLRAVLGRRRLGLPRRDVPQQDPRRGPGRRRRRAVDRQLGHHRELPQPRRLEPVGHLRHLHLLRPGLHPLRPALRQGDQGQVPGGDGLTARARPARPEPLTRLVNVISF